MNLEPSNTIALRGISNGLVYFIQGLDTAEKTRDIPRIVQYRKYIREKLRMLAAIQPEADNYVAHELVNLANHYLSQDNPMNHDTNVITFSLPELHRDLQLTEIQVPPETAHLRNRVRHLL